jgi:hypothetical protein
MQLNYFKGGNDWGEENYFYTLPLWTLEAKYRPNKKYAFTSAIT